MSVEPARWCANCHLQIAPYDLRMVHNETIYHQHCFLLVVREDANPEKADRGEAGPAKTTRKLSA
jgi:hypothetical protein